MADEKFIKFRCDEEFRRLFKAKAAAIGLASQDILRNLADEWLTGAGGQASATSDPPSAAQSDPDHRMLDVILRSGTEDQILGIRSNLKAFNDAIELSDLKAGKFPHSKRKTG